MKFNRLRFVPQVKEHIKKKFLKTNTVDLLKHKLGLPNSIAYSITYTPEKQKLTINTGGIRYAI